MRAELLLLSLRLSSSLSSRLLRLREQLAGLHIDLNVEMPTNHNIPANKLGVILTGLIESLLEAHSTFVISETDGIETLLYLTIGKVLAEEAPRAVASRILLLHMMPSHCNYQDSHGVDDVVQNQLQRLLLAHDDSLSLLSLVLQDTHLASASLLPNVLAHLITVFIFLEEKEQSGTPRTSNPPNPLSYSWKITSSSSSPVFVSTAAIAFSGSFSLESSTFSQSGAYSISSGIVNQSTNYSFPKPMELWGENPELPEPKSGRLLERNHSSVSSRTMSAGKRNTLLKLLFSLFSIGCLLSIHYALSRIEKRIESFGMNVYSPLI